MQVDHQTATCNVNRSCQLYQRVHKVYWSKGFSKALKNLYSLTTYIKFLELQTYISFQLTYEVKVDKRTVEQKVEKSPCLLKGMNVWSGKPWPGSGKVEAKIRSLFFSTSGIYRSPLTSTFHPWILCRSTKQRSVSHGLQAISRALECRWPYSPIYIKVSKICKTTILP